MDQLTCPLDNNRVIIIITCVMLSCQLSSTCLHHNRSNRMYGICEKLFEIRIRNQNCFIPPVILHRISSDISEPSLQARQYHYCGVLYHRKQVNCHDGSHILDGDSMSDQSHFLILCDCGLAAAWTQRERNLFRQNFVNLYCYLYFLGFLL